MGVPFDIETLQVTGQSVTLVPELTVWEFGSAVFGISESGTLVYASPAPAHDSIELSPLVWVDLEGEETPLPIPAQSPRNPRISPDGGRVAYQSGEHIWVYDLATTRNAQLTFEGRNVSPIWSVDGRFVYFLSERSGTDGLDGFRREASGAIGAEQLWTRDRGEVSLTSISPDGAWLVVGESTPDQGLNISLASLGADSVSFRAYLQADWNEYEGTISPNGRWMAYTSVESGVQEVNVRDFPDGSGRWLVSEGAIRRHGRGSTGRCSAGPRANRTKFQSARRRRTCPVESCGAQ